VERTKSVRGARTFDRDRGKDRASAPPTPPYVRIRIRWFDWLCYRPSTKDGSPNEVRAAFDRAMPRSGLWLTCHGPRRLPAVFAASSSLTPRRTSSANRLRPVFHCRQKAQRTRLRIQTLQHRRSFTPNESVGDASYPVLVHRLALLLRASFGPSVAGTPLRFANPSPPSGWVEDFHFQAAGHAQHTVPRPHSCRHSHIRLSLSNHAPPPFFSPLKTKALPQFSVPRQHGVQVRNAMMVYDGVDIQPPCRIGFDRRKKLCGPPDLGRSPGTSAWPPTLWLTPNKQFDTPMSKRGCST